MKKNMRYRMTDLKILYAIIIFFVLQIIEKQIINKMNSKNNETFFSRKFSKIL